MATALTKSERAPVAPPLPTRSGGTRRLPRRWDTLARLRLTRAVLLLLVLVLWVAAVAGVRTRVEAVREIETRTEPLSANAVEIYRSLADADAAVASEFLGGADPSKSRARYEDDLEQAAASLTRAASQAGTHDLTADRIAGITAQLSSYTGLVERARAAIGSPEGVAEVARASDVMQSTILRRAQALQRNESERLDDQYAQARSLPVPVLVLAVVTLAALLVVQLLLFRKTKRVFNGALVLATVTIVGGMGWWTLAFHDSNQDLENSRRNSQSITDALGQAQFAALQARASEVLGLLTPGGGSYETDFTGRMQRLARGDGGGALGAARRFVSGPEGGERIDAVLHKVRAWEIAHRALRQTPTSGQSSRVIQDDRTGTAADAFAAVDVSLSHAVDEERKAFGKEIDRSQGALAGLVAGATVLVLISALASARGLGQRIKEYV